MSKPGIEEAAEALKEELDDYHDIEIRAVKRGDRLQGVITRMIQTSSAHLKHVSCWRIFGQSRTGFATTKEILEILINLEGSKAYFAVLGSRALPDRWHQIKNFYQNSSWRHFPNVDLSDPNGLKNLDKLY